MRDLILISIIYTVLPFSQTQKERSLVCDLPVDPGTGDETRIYMYYDKSTDRCSPFRYQGTGGNGNRFTSEKSCMRSCSFKAEEFYPVDESMACYFRKAPGDCQGSKIRFYYDAVNQKCKKFFWTGCAGNGNRFFDQQRCSATCAGIRANGPEEIEETESDTPTANGLEDIEETESDIPTAQGDEPEETVSDTSNVLAICAAVVIVLALKALWLVRFCIRLRVFTVERTYTQIHISASA